MSDDDLSWGGVPDAAPWPVGIWFSAIANALGACAAAVFLTAGPGARFRGMEPQVGSFLALALLAASVGLFFGLPLSLYDLFGRRRPWWGGLGTLLALTPV